MPVIGFARRFSLRHIRLVMRPSLLVLCLLLTACGNLQNLATKSRAKQRERELSKLHEAAASEASSRLGEKAAGEVVFVDGGGGFVLIRARNGLSLQVGQELQCQGSGGGKLKVTPERKNVFFAADIVSGEPHKGDPVIPIKGSGKPDSRLVPIAAAPLPGSSAPANTLAVDPSSLRPEDLPRSTLDEPGHRPPPMNNADHRRDPGNLLELPPLPQDIDKPLLPEPALPQ